MTTPIEKEKKFGAHYYKPLPMVLCRGEGVYLWDTDGKKYLDMMSAYSAVSHGHAHPRVVKRLQEQAATFAMSSRAFYSDKLGDLEEKLCKLSGLDAMIPMNTGAEAVETAVKAARRWGYQVKKIPKDKAEIIVSRNNFHGRTTTIIGFSSEPLYREGFGPFAPGFNEIPFGDVAALEKAITPNTAAFLTEPVQGEAGIIVPPEGWLKEVQRVCRKHNVLLILDEVQTGLCRTGKMFAFQHEIDRPDGMCLGKALGGGLLPVSAFLATRSVMDVFTPGSHGSTFGGNPLAASVALEALAVMEEEDFAAKANDLGGYLLRKLQGLNSSLISEVRGKGMLIGVEIDPKKATARAVCEKLAERGMLTKETHETVVRLAPPLVITKEQLDWAVTQLSEVLNEV